MAVFKFDGGVCRVVQHGGDFIRQRKDSRQCRLHLRDHRLQLVGNWRRFHGAQPGGVTSRGEIHVTMYSAIPRRDNALAVHGVVVGANGIGFRFQFREALQLLSSSIV